MDSKNVVHVHNEIYSAVKKNEFSGKWVHMESILSDVIQTQKDQKNHISLSYEDPSVTVLILEGVGLGGQPTWMGRAIAVKVDCPLPWVRPAYQTYLTLSFLPLLRRDSDCC